MEGAKQGVIIHYFSYQRLCVSNDIIKQQVKAIRKKSLFTQCVIKLWSPLLDDAVQIEMNMGIRYGHSKFLKNRSLRIVKHETVETVSKSRSP